MKYIKKIINRFFIKKLLKEFRKEYKEQIIKEPALFTDSRIGNKVNDILLEIDNLIEKV